MGCCCSKHKGGEAIDPEPLIDEDPGGYPPTGVSLPTSHSSEGRTYDAPEVVSALHSNRKTYEPVPSRDGTLPNSTAANGSKVTKAPGPGAKAAVNYTECVTKMAPSIEGESLLAAPAERDIYLRGWASKRGHMVKNWKRRFFVLDRETAQVMYYVKDSKEPPYGVDLKGAVSLRSGL